MAYNRINILNRIIDIQNVTIEHTNRGVTQEWIFEHLIYPKYFISKSTYYCYLRCNAKAELKKALMQKEIAASQLSLSF